MARGVLIGRVPGLGDHACLDNMRKLIPKPLRFLWRELNSGALRADISFLGRRWKRALAGERSTITLQYRWDHTAPRWSLIQAVIDKYGFQSYLEIGCANDACFSRVRCDLKVGVDPVAGGTIRKTSDEFFADSTQTFDCIFIDGLHTYEQVRRDIDNALAALSANGVILLHDCLPRTIGEQAVPREQWVWSGDVWKAIVERRTQTEIDTAVCVTDHGVGVIVKRANTDLLDIPHRDFKGLLFADYAARHAELMRPLGYRETFGFIERDGYA